MSDPKKPINATPNLDDAPEYAQYLGNICAHWASVEFHMYRLFELMSGSPPALARSTFYSIESNRGKREILLALGNVLFDNQSEKSILDDIVRRIGRDPTQQI